MPTVGTWLNDELSIKFKSKALVLGKTTSKLLKILVDNFLSQDKKIIKDDVTLELIKSNKELTFVKSKLLGQLIVIGNNVKKKKKNANTQSAVDISVIYKLDEIKRQLERLRDDSKNI